MLNSFFTRIPPFLLLLSFPLFINAQEKKPQNTLELSDDSLEQCVMVKLKESTTDVNYHALRDICLEEIIQVEKPKKEAEKELPEFYKSLLSQKMLAYEPYVITPHELNYILPITYTNNFNHSPYESDALREADDYDEQLSDIEAKFQISFKTPLTQGGIFNESDVIIFAFTLTSWWQVYNENLSRPFRETNYRPEIFYGTLLGWEPFDGNTFFQFGYMHESNGQTQVLSRSWNRIYSKFLYAKGNYVITFTPWWRIPEGETETTLLEAGDDNPDIIDYTGHFELEFAYKWDDLEFELKGRQNFSTNKGSFELGVIYPISTRLNAYFQYSNGYGESLIDYDHSQQKIGIGIAMTELF